MMSLNLFEITFLSNFRYQLSPIWMGSIFIGSCAISWEPQISELLFDGKWFKILFGSWQIVSFEVSVLALRGFVTITNGTKWFATKWVYLSFYPFEFVHSKLQLLFSFSFVLGLNSIWNASRKRKLWLGQSNLIFLPTTLASPITCIIVQ